MVEFIVRRNLSYPLLGNIVCVWKDDTPTHYVAGWYCNDVATVLLGFWLTLCCKRFHHSITHHAEGIPNPVLKSHEVNLGLGRKARDQEQAYKALFKSHIEPKTLA